MNSITSNLLFSCLMVIHIRRADHLTSLFKLSRKFPRCNVFLSWVYNLKIKIIIKMILKIKINWYNHFTSFHQQLYFYSILVTHPNHHFMSHYLHLLCLSHLSITSLAYNFVLPLSWSFLLLSHLPSLVFTEVLSSLFLLSCVLILTPWSQIMHLRMHLLLFTSWP